MELTHTIDSTPSGATLLQAYLAGKAVGILALYPADGEGNRAVFQVWTADEHRRKGVATYLWDVATAWGLNPVHDSNQTEQGRAWAMALAG